MLCECTVNEIHNNVCCFVLQVRMLADPTGAFTKVNKTKCLKYPNPVSSIVTVHAHESFCLLHRQLTCYLTAIRLCRYLETNDPRGNDCFYLYSEITFSLS